MHTPKMGSCILALSSSPHTPADSNDAHDRRQKAGQKQCLSKLQVHTYLCLEDSLGFQAQER
jgi:hypothetical protein